ncbi:MAG: hypothetical protein ACYC4L_04740 [Chloroflexota bacterium]
MPILNYTTSIAVEKTLGEIQAILARAGARSVLIDYSNGTPTAVAFIVPTQWGDQGFRLPANVEATWKALTKQSQSGKVPRRFATREQAARVAWRIVKDWLEAQMAIIEAEMVTLAEVMLPYHVQPSGKTLYQAMEDRRFALPEGRRADE